MGAGVGIVAATSSSDCAAAAPPSGSLPTQLANSAARCFSYVSGVSPSAVAFPWAWSNARRVIGVSPNRLSIRCEITPMGLCTWHQELEGVYDRVTNQFLVLRLDLLSQEIETAERTVIDHAEADTGPGDEAKGRASSLAPATQSRYDASNISCSAVVRPDPSAFNAVTWNACRTALSSVSRVA